MNRRISGSIFLQLTHQEPSFITALPIPNTTLLPNWEANALELPSTKIRVLCGDGVEHDTEAIGVVRDQTSIRIAKVFWSEILRKK